MLGAPCRHGLAKPQISSLVPIAVWEYFDRVHNFGWENHGVRFDAYVQKQLPFTDESYILILNTSCDPAKVPDNLKALYAYVNDPASTSGDALMEKIDGQVKKYNGSRWRWMQVTLKEHVKHIAYMARDEGRSEGDVNARKDVAAKLKAAGMSSDDIAEVTGLNPEEIEEL